MPEFAMRIRLAIFALLASGGAAGCALRGSPLISAPTMYGLPDETPWHRNVEIGRGIQVEFQFEKTTKGNGTLSFPGGGVRTYDSHNDTITFDPFALDTRLVDIDHDGYLDLEVFGTGVRWEEQADREIARRPVRSTFRFDPSTNTFTMIESDPWIMTWVLIH